MTDFLFSLQIDIKTFSEFKHKSSEPDFTKTTQIEHSWIYTFCMKCRGQDDDTPSWEPPMWQKFCPYPLCPSFRQFARLWSIIIIGIIAWIALYVIVGSTAAPGGPLFGLVGQYCVNFLF